MQPVRILIVWMLAFSAGAADFFVSNRGDDTNSGSREEPLATLVRARDAARSDADENSRILLLSNYLRITETLVLNREDDGLTIEAANPAQPCWVSGSTLLDWEVWTRVEGREEPIFETIIPEDYPEIRTVFRCGKPMPRARSRGFVQQAKPPAGVPYRIRKAIDQRHLYLPDEVLNEFGDLSGAMMRVIPRFPWVAQLQPMTRVDRETGLVWSAVPGSYEMTIPAFGHFPQGSLWIENVPEAIDEKGEWCFNPETRKLTMWIQGGDRSRPQGVSIPRMTELVRIEGEIDESALEDKPVRDISIRNLAFVHGNAYGWEEDKTGWGLQHDWEMYDRPTAMVRLRAAENCRIENCRFANSGAAGVRLDLHCRHNTVQHCEFSGLGGVGVLLAGYGLGFKDVNNGNVIADNNIHHIGEHWWHSPAIFVWQSGHNQIVHNHIHHVPYTGIVVSTRTQLNVTGEKESSKTARWDDVIYHFETRDRSWRNREPLMHGRQNEIAWNDIHHVMEKLGDGNGIYISGTGAGNRVHHNFIHDVVSPNMNGAIRCDDDQHEVIMDHNVIARCCGEGIIWKGRCDVINNVIHELRTKTPEGVNTSHQRGFIVLSGASVAGSIVQKNVFLSKHPRYPILFEHSDPWKKHGRPMPPVTLGSCDSDRNLYWNEVNPGWAEDFFERQRKQGVETHSRFADPLFNSPEENDFRLGENSPAVALGIDSVDISSAGPRKSGD